MDLYNFISHKSKIFTYIADSLFFIVVVILLCFYKGVFIDEAVTFYTFSTIVQGFLALVGFLGALTIFKIQLIESEAQKISNGLEVSVKMYNGIKVHSYSWIEMMNACCAILQNKESNFQVEDIKTGYGKLCTLRDEKSPIRNSMVSFSLITMVNIVIALLGIPLSKLFVSSELFLVNTIYTLITLGLSYYSIKGAFKVIRSCLGYSFRLSI